ncbi:MAG TPA: pitrilysin family protein [Gemmatimonadaceae bacterium]|nr:pitrilysin family protein [Gemmatimonadaceae bacterium]
MMRRIFLLPALALVASVQRPAVARAQADTSTTSFDVNGLKVILRHNGSNDVVAANVYLLGGTQQLSPATQGLEALLLNASERGTQHFPGETARQIITRLGSTISVEPEADWTLFGFTGIRQTFDSTWAVFADRLMAPTLDSAQVELVRARMMTEVREERNAPDPLVTRLADSLAWVGHPYGFAPEGSESSLFSISLDRLKRYQATQMVTSRMLLVVVGNVDRPHLEQLVGSTLAQLPHGNYTWSPPHMPPKLGRALVVQPAQLPTNYILGYYTGPPASDSDYQALRVATAVLAGRFFTEIRSQRNLSYEVDAPFVDRAISNGGVYVTTVHPNETLGLMRTEIDRLQREVVDAEGLSRLVQQFLTDYFLKNEVDADQATFLARAQLYQGDYRAASHFVDDLRRVRPEDVQRVAQRYMRDFRFVYLGNPDSLSRDLIARF